MGNKVPTLPHDLNTYHGLELNLSDLPHVQWGTGGKLGSSVRLSSCEMDIDLTRHLRKHSTLSESVLPLSVLSI